MKKIAVLSLFIFGITVISKSNIESKAEVELFNSDTIIHQGHKFLFDFGNKTNSKYRIVIENMKMILYTKEGVSDIVISSYVAETKVKSVMVQYPTEGASISLVELYVNAKGNVVYISDITGKTKDGKTINKIVPGFKITVL